jgi:hypothetical protein
MVSRVAAAGIQAVAAAVDVLILIRYFFMKFSAVGSVETGTWNF